MDQPAPTPIADPEEDQFPTSLHYTVPPGDRWTKRKMADFLRELAVSHSVSAAAKSVGMSRQSAYRLRNRLKGAPFDIAWEAAFQHGYDALHHAALERALHGVETLHLHKGEVVAKSRRYDERLTTFLLASRNRHGAQRLGRFTASSEFWSERWDRLLDRIENGPADWAFDEKVAIPSEAEVVMKLDQRHAPDPVIWDFK
jgi:hypothetical protein